MKPPAISRAIKLQWFSIALSIVAVPLEWSFLRSISSVGSIVFGTIFDAGVLIFFIWKISQGRNWTRITLLIMFLLGGLVAPWAISRVPHYPPIGWVIFVVQTILQGYALFLMFTNPGSDFFRPAH